MHRWVALALLFATPLIAQPANEASDRAALEALNLAWLNSYVTRDANTLGAILADDFVAVYGGGRQRTRTELLGGMTSGPQIVSVRPENVSIRISGDVAVITARSVIQISGADGVTEARNDYADVYVRRDGRWRAISAHIVRVANPS